MDEIEAGKQKSHHKSKNKLNKRKDKTKDLNVDPKLRNPKAFTFNSVVKAERKFRRGQDIETKKERVPEVDRTPVEPPPFIIAIVGPPKVGKSTLFQNLIKSYTRQTLSDIKGPVTVVSGKKRRLTLIECNNDINSMIDTAKIADLVLLLVDASFGFEMEIFEFLNICQVHGFPQIMGVLTHLDLFKNKKTLKKTKKTLKHRFWTEVYPGSKLFYLSGYHPMTESYPKNEIHNLARFISVMKFRPTLWRSEHAYLVADRLEDITPLDSIRLDPKADRSLCLYGYVHGTFLKPHISLHIPGLGDFTPKAVNSLVDPCPLPMKEKILRRSLNEKEKMIYAPFSGVGGIVYDKDAVYIDLGGSHSHRGKKIMPEKDTTEETLPEFVGELRDLKSTLDEKMESAGLQLFSESNMITAAEFEEDEIEDEDEEGDSEEEDEEGNEGFQNESSEDEDEDESEDEEMGNDQEEDDILKFITSEDGRMRRKVLQGEVEEAYHSRLKNRPLQKKIYDADSDYFFINAKSDFDTSNCAFQDQGDFIVEIEVLKDFFVGGDYAEKAQNMLDDDDEDIFGDYEELDQEVPTKKGDDDGKELPQVKENEEESEKDREEKKLKLKEKFNMEYDEGGEKSFYKEWKEQVEEQTKKNRTFFQEIDDPRLLQDLQGLAPGTYVRIEINRVPYEFIERFEPQKVCPLLLGSLDTPNQEHLGIIQARVKKHRWYSKILKTRDPVILSVGWRRFQTIALYSVHDHNMRNRMVKYTPEHLHCIANFYGPLTPQGTGIIGIAPAGINGFQITLTGTILDMDKTSELVKKLKLIGTPLKIYKKSAFIQGMFTSQLEVAKFVGARLKTVSGIRGVIKRPLREPTGAFRGTFEDKILASDIVFCRTWATVDIPKFFLSLQTHIHQPRVLKTLGQLKAEGGVRVTPNQDHLYTEIERQERNFKPFRIPKALLEKLPFKDRPVIEPKKKEEKNITLNDNEKKMMKFLKDSRKLLDDKDGREKAEKAKKVTERAKKMKKIEERQTRRQKELRKKVFKTLGQLNPNKEAGGGRKFKGKGKKR